jgi:ketosteroid isomerase-like protein
VTSEEARAFALRWNEAWNRRDLEAVLADFDGNVVFTSPTALVVTGAGTVCGKEALRAYWTKTTKRVSENLTIGPAGRVVAAEVFHGVGNAKEHE